MELKKIDDQSPKMSAGGYFIKSDEKPLVENELLVYIWPPVIQLNGLNGAARKKLLFIWCLMIVLMLLLLAFGIADKPGPEGKPGRSLPSSYPPVEMCR